MSKYDSKSNKIRIDIRGEYVLLSKTGPFIAGIMCGKGTDYTLEQGIASVIVGVKEVAKQYIVKSEFDLSLPKEDLRLARHVICTNAKSLFILSYPKKMKYRIDKDIGRFRGLDSILVQDNI